MYRIKKHEVRASDIAEYLNCKLYGEDALLHAPQSIRTSLAEIGNHPSPQAGEPWLLITTEDRRPPEPWRYIVSPNPDRDLALVLLEFFAVEVDEGVHPTAVVASDVELGRGVKIGAHSVIDTGVKIGDGVWIMNHVTIRGPAQIGKRTIIKDGAVVGSEGYGFVENESGRMIHAPQLGKVLVGENVWIGANSTVERGMLDETVIEDDVKIDDLVHIGKGSRIGRKSLITAGCVVAYDVQIGEAVTLAPNVSVRESCSIVARTLVGQGAVVVDDITEAGTYIGVPARKVIVARY